VSNTKKKKKQTVDSKKGCQIAKGKKKAVDRKMGCQTAKSPKKIKKKKKQTASSSCLLLLRAFTALPGSSSSLVAAVRACCRGWCRGGGWVVSRLQVGCWVVSSRLQVGSSRRFSCVRLGKL